MNARTRTARPAALLAALLAAVLAAVVLLLAGPGAGATPARAQAGAGAGADETAGPSSSASSSATPEPERPDPRQGLEGVDDLTPVSGTSFGSTAPSLRSGRYIDTTPSADGYRIYKIPRTLPRSTIAFGLTLLGPDVNPKKRPVVRIYARIPDAAEGDPSVRVCGVARVDDTDKATVMPVSSLAGWSYRSKPLCETAPELYLIVTNQYFRLGADEPSLLTPADAPYELDVWEQPEVTNADDLKQVYDDTWVFDAAGTPDVQAQPGLSPSAAVVLPAGKTAAVDLPLGRVAWFAVPVEVGERLQVLVQTADGAAVAGAGFETRIYSPVGGSVLVPDPSQDPPAAPVGNLAAGPNLLSAITGEVYAGNRTDNEGSSYSQHSALTTVGGDYLVAVFVQRLDGAPVSTLPITLKTRLDEHDGYPGDKYVDADYASALTPFPAPTGPEPTAYVAAEVSPSTVRQAGRSTGDWAVIGGLGVAALAFAGVGGALLRRRA